MIKLTNLNIPLEVIFPNNKFILLSVREAKEYIDGKTTGNIIGFKYEVVDTDSFEKFTVKVLEHTPSISQKLIDSSDERINVSFTNSVCKPYRTATGFYELSIKADSITIEVD